MSWLWFLSYEKFNCACHRLFPVENDLHKFPETAVTWCPHSVSVMKITIFNGTKPIRVLSICERCGSRSCRACDAFTSAFDCKRIIDLMN